jgi:uncharacterized protein (DUF58 family)
MSESGEPTQIIQKSSVSPKAVAFAVLAVAIFLIGVVTNSILVFVSLAIMAIFGIVLITVQPPTKSVTIRRHIDHPKLYEQDFARVTLEVSNHSELQIPFVQVKDYIPRDLLKAGEKPAFSFSVGPLESKSFSYEINPKTFGLYSLGPVMIFTSDSFGFLQYQALHIFSSTISVYPKFTERLSRLEPRPRRTKYWPGEIASRKTGIGSDFFSIRPSIAGESTRRINWRASARSNDQDRLLVNEYMAELGAETMIIVDCRAVSALGARGESTFSHSIRAAISIADRLLKDKNRVGLFAISANSQRLSPRYGQRQYDRIVESLLLVRPGEDWAIGNLVKYLHFFYPHISQVIFISPLGDEGSVRAVNELSRAHYDLFVISPNPLNVRISQNSKGRGMRKDYMSRDEGKIALALSKLERDSLIEELRRSNAVVIDWHVSDPLEEAIELNRRSLARRVAQARM